MDGNFFTRKEYQGRNIKEYSKEGIGMSIVWSVEVSTNREILVQNIFFSFVSIVIQALDVFDLISSHWYGLKIFHILQWG